MKIVQEQVLRVGRYYYTYLKMNLIGNLWIMELRSIIKVTSKGSHGCYRLHNQFFFTRKCQFHNYCNQGLLHARLQIHDKMLYNVICSLHTVSHKFTQRLELCRYYVEGNNDLSIRYQTCMRNLFLHNYETFSQM